jgi:hypothetical protein
MLATLANDAGQAILLVRGRLDSVDLVRDVIMILMTLGHTRDFLGVTGVNPADSTLLTPPKLQSHFFSRAGLHTFAPHPPGI